MRYSQKNGGQGEAALDMGFGSASREPSSGAGQTGMRLTYRKDRSGSASARSAVLTGACVCVVPA